MATIADFLNTIKERLGYLPVFPDLDPFAPFRDPYAPAGPTPDTGSPVVASPGSYVPVTDRGLVPVFKRPTRFTVLPLAPKFNAGDPPGPNQYIKGLQIVPQNLNRTALYVANVGFGTAWISSFNLVSRLDFPIHTSERVEYIFSGQQYSTPTNALYAVGEDAGADLRVLEVVLAPVGSTEFIA